MKEFSWRKILLVIIISMIFYFILILLTDINEVQRAYRQYLWIYMIPVILFVFINYILRAERWNRYLHYMSIKIRRKRSYWIFFAGLSMSITPLKAGEILKALLLRIEKNVSTERGLAIVFTERMSDLMGMILLIGIGSFALSYGLLSFILVIIGVAIVLIIINSKKISKIVFNWMGKIHRFRNIKEFLEKATQDARTLLTGKILFIGTSYSAIAWLAECVAFYFIIIGSSIQISLLECIFIYSFSSVIGAVSMLPGGMGTTEATMIGLLIAISVDPAIASFVVILTRFSTLWLAAIIGIIMLALYSRKVNLKIENVSETV